MANIRFCFLYGKSYLIKIDENLITLDYFRKIIENLLPPFREINDFIYVVSGKPPRMLNINNEQEFNEHQTLITNGCYIFIKLIR